LECFGEGDHVERHGYGLGQVERDPDGTTDAGSEGPGNNEILPAPFHTTVGSDLGNCQGGGDGHQVAEHNDQQGSQEPNMSHGVSKPQEHDGAENGAD
jgi:hypothetical protein